MSTIIARVAPLLCGRSQLDPDATHRVAFYAESRARVPFGFWVADYRSEAEALKAAADHHYTRTLDGIVL